MTVPRTSLLAMMFFWRLEREHAEDFDEVRVVDVNLDGAGVADVDL